jgi:adenylate cyclase
LRSRSATPPQAERQLAAVIAADIAGYSRLMGADEEGTLARLKACRRELIDPGIARHRGRIVKTTGDGLLVEFSSPVEAVRWAVETQQGMIERNADVADDRRINFRVGINLGDVIVDDRDLYGDAVNIAARLENLADPGGICISRIVWGQIRDRLALPFEDGGEQSVKNIARPVRVYALSADAVAAVPRRRCRRRRGGGDSFTSAEILPLPLWPPCLLSPVALPG